MENCPYCSKEIVQIDNRRPKVYCNDKCRGLYWRMEKSTTTKTIIKVKFDNVDIEKKPKVTPTKKTDWMVDLLS